MERPGDAGLRVSIPTMLLDCPRQGVEGGCVVYRGEGKGHAHRRVWGPTDTLCSFTASVTRPRR